MLLRVVCVCYVKAGAGARLTHEHRRARSRANQTDSNGPTANGPCISFLSAHTLYFTLLYVYLRSILFLLFYRTFAGSQANFPPDAFSKLASAAMSSACSGGQVRAARFSAMRVGFVVLGMTGMPWSSAHLR